MDSARRGSEMSDTRVVFYCDGSRCSVCNMDMCMHTTDIEHAENFQKVANADVWYEDISTTTWLNSYSPYTCEKCGFHVDSKTRYCPDCGRRASNYEV